jgi:hypothetical protein
MPSILTRTCEACQKQHVLCYGVGDELMDESKRYRYVCPETGSTVEFQISFRYPRVSKVRPASAVPVTVMVEWKAPARR